MVMDEAEFLLTSLKNNKWSILKMGYYFAKFVISKCHEPDYWINSNTIMMSYPSLTIYVINYLVIATFQKGNYAREAYYTPHYLIHYIGRGRL